MVVVHGVPRGGRMPLRVPEWGCQGGGSALEGAQGGVRKMGASVRFGGVLCGNGPRPGHIPKQVILKDSQKI